MKTLRQILAEAVEDKEYSDNYERGTKSFQKLVNHIEYNDYNIHMSTDGKAPKGTDITYHIGMGDTSPNAVTVHGDGKAANDETLHKIGRRLDRRLNER